MISYTIIWSLQYSPERHTSELRASSLVEAVAIAFSHIRRTEGIEHSSIDLLGAFETYRAASLRGLL